MHRHERPERSGHATWPWLVAAVLLISGASAAILFYQRHKVAALPAPQTPAAYEEDAITLTGKVRARNVTSVPAPIDGTLESVEVIEGQEVYEGQLLARIKNSALDLAEEQAKLEVDRLQGRLNSLESQLISARLEASRADADATRAKALFAAADKAYARQKMLLAEGATPRLTFEKAEKEYETLKAESAAVAEIARQAESKIEIALKNAEEARRLLAEKNAELDNAQAQLLATEVHAPVDGLLVGQRAAAGSEVTLDMKNLFEIAVDVTDLELAADATPSELARLQTQRPAILQIAEAGNEPIAATLKRIEGTQAIFEFKIANPAVKPGLTGQIRIRVDPQPPAATSPVR